MNNGVCFCKASKCIGNKSTVDLTILEMKRKKRRVDYISHLCDNCLLRRIAFEEQ